MWRIILLATMVLVLGGCGASWHLQQSEKHLAIAIAKGAKIEDKVKIETDTIVKDTVIFVEGSSLDDSFGFNDTDTVFLENKEGVKAKIKIDSKNKKGSANIDCPDKIINVPQKYYVNRRITTTRKISGGYTLVQYIGIGIFGLLLGGVIGYLWPKKRNR